MRVVSWFSCGAASAVATKLALNLYDKVDIFYCEVKEEHSDNKRFLADCQEWFGQEITVLGNDTYDRSIYDVFYKTRYLCGPTGARCTGELKKKVREANSQPGDLNIFGYTAEEEHRVNRFIDGNNDVEITAPLVDAKLTKADCLALVEDAGIKLPAMYLLGYKNNNCRGCVKSGSPAYWLKIKQDFPDMFARMNKVEHHLGRAVCKIAMTTANKRYKDRDIDRTLAYWRPKLDELPADIKPMDDSVDIQCGIFCELMKDEL